MGRCRLGRGRQWVGIVGGFVGVWVGDLGGFVGVWEASLRPADAVSAPV